MQDSAMGNVENTEDDAAVGQAEIAPPATQISRRLLFLRGRDSVEFVGAARAVVGVRARISN